jgi:hypothetical protein
VKDRGCRCGLLLPAPVVRAKSAASPLAEAIAPDTIASEISTLAANLLPCATLTSENVVQPKTDRLQAITGLFILTVVSLLLR